MPSRLKGCGNPLFVLGQSGLRLGIYCPPLATKFGQQFLGESDAARLHLSLDHAVFRPLHTEA